jgi:hypothetical protein
MLVSTTTRLLLALLLTFPSSIVAQIQHEMQTEKGGTPLDSAPHPLSWWTENPLLHDASGDLMLAYPGQDGQLITAGDYHLDKNVTTIGVLSGHKILQIILTIHPGPRVIGPADVISDAHPIEWKDLLVQVGSDRYVQIYGLHYDQGGLLAELTPAALYGSGANVILGTYDPDTGNGGSCFDGYWWFDRAGAHPVDFSSLIRSIAKAIPKDATFTWHCWALHPKSSAIESGVQERDAACHACGGLGTVRARYRVDHGKAVPLSVRFTPEKQQ